MNEFQFNLNILTNFQLITIRNSSDGNNIKPQAIKRQVKLNKFDFYTHGRPSPLRP